MATRCGASWLPLISGPPTMCSRSGRASARSPWACSTSPRPSPRSRSTHGWPSCCRARSVHTHARHVGCAAGDHRGRPAGHRRTGSPCPTSDLAAPEYPTALVANLPYNVAVPVLLHLLAEVPTLRRVLVMVQAEVADRLVAGPGIQDLRLTQREDGAGTAPPAGPDRSAVRCSGRYPGSIRRWSRSSGAPSRAPTTAPRCSPSSTPPSRSAARRCGPRWPAGRVRPPCGGRADPGKCGPVGPWRGARRSTTSPGSPPRRRGDRRGRAR